MRGEHPITNPNDYTGTGSSPHARGTLHELLFVVDAVGIIPACAGNTLIR